MLFFKNQIKEAKRPSKSLLAIGVAAAALSQGLHAQSNDDAVQLEEIVVEGFASSLRSAINNKRYSDDIRDVISSEDIGAFPDDSLADSLQRVTGVSVARTGGQASQISIRGTTPDQIRVEINGASAVGAGDQRAFDFDSLSADLVGSIEVIKSQSASDIEGGIGGIVRINNRKPLSADGKTTGAINVENQRDDLADSDSPRISGLFTQKLFDDTFGITIGASFEDTERRLDRIISDGFRRTAIADGPDSFRPTRQGIQANRNIQERRDANIGLQFRPNDRLDINFTGSIYELERTFANAGINTNQANCTNAPGEEGNCVFDENNTLIESVGRLTSVIPFSNFVNRGDEGFATRLELNYQVNDALTLDFSADYSAAERNSNPNLDLNTRFLVVFTDPARNDLGLLTPQAVVNTDGIPSVFIDPNDPLNQLDADGDGLSDVVDLADPLSFPVRSRQLVQNINENTASSVALDFDWELASGGIVEFGFRSASQVAERTSRIAFVDNTRFALDPSSFDDADLTRVDQIDLLPSFGLDLPSEIAAINSDAVAELSRDELAIRTLQTIGFDDAQIQASIDAGTLQADAVALGVNGNNGEADFIRDSDDILATALANAVPTQIFKTTEDTTAIYAKYNFETEFAGAPLRGNFGARYIRTEVDSSGFANLGGGEFQPVLVENTYNDVLPSATLIWEFREDMVLRTSAASVLTRPTLTELRAQTNINFNEADEVFRATQGNIELDPFRADTFDISWEWYFSDTGLVSAAFFWKDVESEIINQGGDFRFGDSPFASNADLIEEIGITDDDNVEVTRPENVPGAITRGIELSYQSAFTFLPEAFHNFGTTLNYTFVPESLSVQNRGFHDVDILNDAELCPTGVLDECVESAFIALPVFNTSENTVNATLYYDNGTFDARLSYNWRDEYLRVITNIGTADRQAPRFTEDYGQFDANMRYRVTDNLSFNFSAVNLTNETSRDFEAINQEALGDTSLTNRTALVEEFGRTFVFGASYRF